MKQNVVTIEYPDDLLLSLKESRVEFEKEARLLLALKLYELGKISSGKAAKIAGLNRVEFLMGLGKYKVSPFQVDLDEILEEAGGV
jgi:predicted HTH domain antitoxin